MSLHMWCSRARQGLPASQCNQSGRTEGRVWSSTSHEMRGPMPTIVSDSRVTSDAPGACQGHTSSLFKRRASSRAVALNYSLCRSNHRNSNRPSSLHSKSWADSMYGPAARHRKRFMRAVSGRDAESVPRETPEAREKIRFCPMLGRNTGKLRTVLKLELEGWWALGAQTRPTTARCY